MILKKKHDKSIRRNNLLLRLLSSYRLIFAFIIGVLIVVNVYYAVNSSSLGTKLSKIEKEQSMAQEKNVNLKRNLAGLTSYAKLTERAKILGFTELSNIYYLKVEEAVAQATK